MPFPPSFIDPDIDGSKTKGQMTVYCEKLLMRAAAPYGDPYIAYVIQRFESNISAPSQGDENVPERLQKSNKIIVSFYEGLQEILLKKYQNPQSSQEQFTLEKNTLSFHLRKALTILRTKYDEMMQSQQRGTKDDKNLRSVHTWQQ